MITISKETEDQLKMLLEEVQELRKTKRIAWYSINYDKDDNLKLEYGEFK